MALIPSTRWLKAYFCYITNRLHLAQKYAWVFVRGHYLFREANSLPVRFEEQRRVWTNNHAQAKIFDGLALD